MSLARTADPGAGPDQPAPPDPERVTFASEALTWSGCCGCRRRRRCPRSPSPGRSPASRTRSPGCTRTGSRRPASPRSPSTTAGSARAAAAGDTRTARASWPTCGRRSRLLGPARGGPGPDRTGRRLPRRRLRGAGGGGDPRVKAVSASPAATTARPGSPSGWGWTTTARRSPSFLDGYDDFLPAVAPGGARGRDGRRRAVRLLRHRPVRLTALGEPGDPRLAAHADDLRRARRGAAPRRDPTAGRARPARAYCAPELAAELHRRAAGDKEIVWLDCAQHIDLYDREPYVTVAAIAAAAFLHRHL